MDEIPQHYSTVMEVEAYLQKVGKNIKRIRLAKKMKQVDVAYACNFDKQTLYNIESGRTSNITLKTIFKLANALETSISELVEI